MKDKKVHLSKLLFFFKTGVETKFYVLIIPISQISTEIFMTSVRQMGLASKKVNKSKPTMF